MIQFILTGMLILLILFLLVLFICDIYINMAQFRKIWIFFSALVFGMVLFFVPKAFIDWDLLRLYKHIDNIREVGLNEALRYTEYKELFIVKYWMYIVSRVNNNGWFTAVPLLLDFLIFGHVVTDLWKKKKKRNLSIKFVLLTAFIWLSMMGLKLAISDVRCVLAMEICGVAFYREYICKDKMSKSVILYIAAMLIHHFTLVFLMFRILLLIKKIVKNYLFILVGMLAFQFIIYEVAQVMYNYLGGGYLWTVARKLVNDWELYGFSNYFFKREMSMKILYLCFIYVFLFGFLTARKAKRHISNTDETKTVMKANDALLVLCCMGLGFAFNYLLLERLLYIASYIFAINYWLLEEQGEARFKLRYILPVLIYVLYINDINAFVANALGYFYL